MADPARIEALLEEVESLDPSCRDIAGELVQELVELYGDGLGRIVEVVAARSDLCPGTTSCPVAAVLLLIASA